MRVHSTAAIAAAILLGATQMGLGNDSCAGATTEFPCESHCRQQQAMSSTQARQLHEGTGQQHSCCKSKPSPGNVLTIPGKDATRSHLSEPFAGESPGGNFQIQVEKGLSIKVSEFRLLLSQQDRYLVALRLRY